MRICASLLRPMSNVDESTVAGFGDEWQRKRDPVSASIGRAVVIFQQYFGIFPWADLPGRRGRRRLRLRLGPLGAPRRGAARRSSPSRRCEPAALGVARRNLVDHSNCAFHRATVDHAPLADGSLDFAYSLGVLHHIPDTAGALAACVRKLKPVRRFSSISTTGSTIARPGTQRWRASELARAAISRLPHGARHAASEALAAGIYWPLARAAKLAEAIRASSRCPLPLSYYRDRSFYVMRNDALDRFGTRLEQRFTRDEIATMMRDARIRHHLQRDDALLVRGRRRAR